MDSGGIFDYEGRKERLEEVLLRLEDPTVWNDPDEAQSLGQERARLEETLGTLDALSIEIQEALELLELAREENDQDTFDELNRETGKLGKRLERL